MSVSQIPSSVGCRGVVCQCLCVREPILLMVLLERDDRQEVDADGYPTIPEGERLTERTRLSYATGLKLQAELQVALNYTL